MRERVDDVANHVAAVRQLVLLTRDLFVLLAQLGKEMSLLQCQHRLFGEGLQRGQRVVHEGAPGIDTGDQNVLGAALAGNARD